MWTSHAPQKATWLALCTLSFRSVLRGAWGGGGTLNIPWSPQYLRILAGPEADPIQACSWSPTSYLAFGVAQIFTLGVEGGPWVAV